MFIMRICLIRRQGLALGTTTCADCTAGFYCAAGSLNLFGGTNVTGTKSVLVSRTYALQCVYLCFIHCVVQLNSCFFVHCCVFIP